MKNQLFYTLCIWGLFATLTADAQRSYRFADAYPHYEWGFKAGVSRFKGDVSSHSTSSSSYFKNSNLGDHELYVGGNYTYYISDYFAVRGSLEIGRISGYDSTVDVTVSAHNRSRRLRNLDFRNTLFEIAALGEFYPLAYLAERNDYYIGKFQPYITAGVGLLFHNPQGQYTNSDGTKRWVNLRPLHTEGQTFSEYGIKNYSRLVFSVPVGAGFKTYLSENFYVGIEFLHRFAFSDYLDDVSKVYIDPNLFYKYLNADQAKIASQMMFKRGLVSERSVSEFIGKQRGNPKDKDAFFTLQLRVGLRFSTY